MANNSQNISHRHHSSAVERRSLIEIEVNFAAGKNRFLPGETLECEYRVQTRGDVNIIAIETSVLWMTVGKGEEDLGVHFFERRMRGEIEQGEIAPKFNLRTVLPRSPLSYEGQILSVRWAVRVRAILGRGAEEVKDANFALGNVQTEHSLKPSRPKLEIAKTDEEINDQGESDG